MIVGAVNIAGTSDFPTKCRMGCVHTHGCGDIFERRARVQHSHARSARAGVKGNRQAVLHSSIEFAASIGTVTVYGLRKVRTGVSREGLSLQNEKTEINLKPRRSVAIWPTR
jgi:hypothetical protein